MTLSELLTLARRYMDEPDDSEFEDEEVVQAINLEFSDLCDVFQNMGQDYFSKEWITPVDTGATEYWLPYDAASIRKVEWISSGYVTGVDPFFVVSADASADEIAPEGYTLLGQRFRIEAPADAGYLRFRFNADAPPLHDGTAQAGGSDTITLATTADNGTVLTNDNVYYGLSVVLTAQTGAGQRRWIKQYDGATKQATLDSAWGTNPDVTSDYSLEAPFSGSVQEMLALGAVLRLKGISQEDDTSPAARLYMGKMERLVTKYGRRRLRSIIKRPR